MPSGCGASPRTGRGRFDGQEAVARLRDELQDIVRAWCELKDPKTASRP